MAFGMHYIVSAFLVAIAHSAEVVQTSGSGSGSSDVAAYEAFRNRHGREEVQGSADYEIRLKVFSQRRAEVKAHNARPDKIWWAGINKFADMSDEEYRAMLGYRRAHSSPAAQAPIMRGASFVQVEYEYADYSKEEKDYKFLNASRFLREQGACGSCWAVAAVGALEMHGELYEKVHPAQRLSFKQMMDCTPNPNHCGGNGGCSGATAELGFGYAASKGLVFEKEYKDGDVDGQCQHFHHTPALQPTGFTKLPENELLPLMTALYEKGPIVVSVDAEPWTIYSSGVFDGCHEDATVNHAVLLVGYGKDGASGEDYWKIRNSWGLEFGEDGFMRIKRHGSDKGKAGFCGTDKDPRVGVGCDDSPKTLPVCGMCGILSDSSYPKV